mmetsp:Transcript_10654/g.15037  ORF Transcript_10654/g.15037 Transcript_10654/m.15037 type:complete len:201 (-) Transcript_10654:50-652(-)
MENEISDQAAFLISKVANDVFSIPNLYPYQMEVLKRLAMMRFRTSSVPPSPVLLVSPTGGGKSLIRDVYSVLFRGVSLTIVPTLALGLDQKDKVWKRAHQTFGRVIPIHVDEILSMDVAKNLISMVKSLPSDTTKSIMFFASPQILTEKKHWKKFFQTLISQNLLRLIVVDEIQLFVHYALSFRTKFAKFVRYPLQTCTY